MDKALVSVVIPSYNASQWIRATIDSALRQSYAPLEVVVVDDASTDETRQLLKEMGPRVRVYHNPANQGVSASRNRAIREAKGEYIALLDHDDIWHPEKLERQMALFQKDPGLGLVFSDCRYETNAGKSWRSFEASAPGRGHVFDRLLEENFIPCLTAVFPKKTGLEAGGFRENLKILEDHDFFLRIAQKHRVDYVDQPLATYRLHEMNFTKRRDIYHQEKISLYQTYGKKAFEGETALQYLGLGAALLKTREISKGTRALAAGFLGALSHPVALFKAAEKTCGRRKRVAR